MRELVTNFTDFKLPPLFVAFFSTTTLLWYNRTNFRYEKRLKSTNKELQETQEELIAKNEEYEAINRNLEALVAERTKIIDSKNKQIIDYANINAHKVRGPLARIMGLINISEYSNDPEELKHIFEKLRNPSQELNIIIEEINKTLDEGSSDDVEVGY
jgi:signal transduction histidine kinase